MSRTRDLSKLLNDNVTINTLEEVAKQEDLLNIDLEGYATIEDLENVETDPLTEDFLTMGG
jgi:FKBP-type peptidyl-prolyl cis-trans isomerase (trigger factor)